MAGETVYVNVEEGVKRVVNNTRLYVTLLKKFKADTNMGLIEDRLGASDFEKAQGAAHTLKGIAANLSLSELFEKVRDLEARIKEKAVPPGALDGVKSAYDETIKKIDEVIAKYG
jgi:HPt (histidine-containing phosphotransfer) domain-containing protein